MQLPEDTVSQITCQEACHNRGEDCVGISCSSYWQGANHSLTDRPYACDKECYVCSSQNLVDGEHYGDIFVKRPGN